jgi:hypothetical protein
MLNQASAFKLKGKAIKCQIKRSELMITRNCGPEYHPRSGSRSNCSCDEIQSLSYSKLKDFLYLPKCAESIPMHFGSFIPNQ